MLTADQINPMLTEILTKENQVVVISQPETENTVAISKEDAVGALNTALDAQYEAYVDEVITDPLIEKLPKAGKIKSTKAGAFGTTEYTLSNGVKVIIKPTDYKADEVLFTAYKNGGKSLYSQDEANEVVLISDIFDSSKMGKFDSNKLTKYLAGKNVSLSYNIGNAVTSFNGSSTVKDLPTLMELIYSAITDTNADPEFFATQMEQAKSLYKNMDKNPNMVFNKRVAKDRYAGNKLYAQPDYDMLNAVDYQKGLNIYKNSVANAADYTFIFTGNVDEATIKPLIAQYIATLPSKGKATAKKVAPIASAKGVIKDTFDQTMQVPATMIYTNVIGTELPYSVENDQKVSLIGDILEIIYTETLREEEGGTYSPYAGGSFNPYTGEWNIMYVFQTNAAQQDGMIKRANEEFNNLLQNGAPEAAFNKAKEAMIKQLEINERTNRYWSEAVLSNSYGVDIVSGERAAIEGITLEGLNAFMKNLYDGKNFLQVVMVGVEEDK
jgi:zinc protease